MKTGNLWLIFWLVVLALALVGYIFSKRREEDRQRLRERAVRLEQELAEKRLRLLERLEPEIEEQFERLPLDEQALIASLPSKELEKWLRDQERNRLEKEQRKDQPEQSQLEQYQKRQTEGQYEEELLTEADELNALDTSLDQTSREPIPDSVRREVWLRDREHCVICGSRDNLGVDHIIPLSKGGSSTARNLHLLCQTCKRSIDASI